MAEEKIVMTQEGLNKLEAEYRHLLDVERPEVIEALQAARAQGDLSENADYDAARARQAEIEARIAEIEHIKDIVEIASTGSNKQISIGCLVTYKEKETGEEHTIQLVGSIEADAMAEPYPLISNESALGMALIGSSVGESKMVESVEPYEIKILNAKIANN